MIPSPATWRFVGTKLGCTVLRPFIAAVCQLNYSRSVVKREPQTAMCGVSWAIGMGLDFFNLLCEKLISRILCSVDS